MFTLNVKLQNAEEVREFKQTLEQYDNKISIIAGGNVVARPMLTSSPYITPLDDITINFYSDSVNEFMNMIMDLNQYISDKQDSYTSTVMAIVRKRIKIKEEEESSNQEVNQ